VIRVISVKQELLGLLQLLLGLSPDSKLVAGLLADPPRPRDLVSHRQGLCTVSAAVQGVVPVSVASQGVVPSVSGGVRGCASVSGGTRGCVRVINGLLWGCMGLNGKIQE
jgi:hypothetical protein